tara:strand:+ start:1759 stop:6936 length:5178 start_codon:yes stop_codon:yes gene_type:complete
MAKKQIRDYIFSPGIAGVGTLKLLGKYDSEQLLLITNTEKNEVLYNFADTTRQVSVAFNQTGSDPDFINENMRTNGVTTITFLYDTTAYASSDPVQIFVEQDEQRTRPYDFGTDAIERMRFAAPESMLDADFEYGIQPTKWQSIDLLRNYPSIYEIPGSDIATTEIVTDASAGSSGIGPSLITVTTILEHGLSVGDPISMKGLADSVIGFSSAEGSFIINTVPNSKEFTYYSKAKVGTTAGSSLKSSFTFLKEAGFYTGAEIGTSPTFTVDTNGSAGNFATEGSTPAGSVTFGINPSSTLPPIGAPLSATGIATGTQVTGVVGTNTTLNITNSFVAPVSTITFNDTQNIAIGAALNNGSGDTIFVTNIEGSVVTLSSPYTTDKTGNSFISGAVDGIIQNFGLGIGSAASTPIHPCAVFNVQRTKGAYTSVSINEKTEYSNLAPTWIGGDNNGGAGVGALFTVIRTGGSSAGYTVSLNSGGENYVVAGNVIFNILGSQVGGVDGTPGVGTPADEAGNDLRIEITSVDGNGAIDGFTVQSTHSNISGSPSVVASTSINDGRDYFVGEKITIYGNQLEGSSPEQDLDIYITGVGAEGNITSYNTFGVGLDASQTYTNQNQDSTSGSGINAQFDIDRTGSGVTRQEVHEILIGGTIETGDTFKAIITETINSTISEFEYTALAGDTVTEVRNGLVLLINDLAEQNAGNPTPCYAVSKADQTPTNGVAVIDLFSKTPGVNFLCAVVTEDSGGFGADTQTMSVSITTTNSNTSTSPSYTVTTQNQGTGYAINDTITINGSRMGGVDSTNDLTITVSSVTAAGAITGISHSGTAVDGSEQFDRMFVNAPSFGARFLPSITGGVYSPTVDDAGTGYKVGYQFKILGSTLGGLDTTNDMTITVTDITSDGGVLAVSASGTPVTGDSLVFYPAISLSSPTTQVIATATTVSYSAIAQIKVEFASNHGLVPGDTILSAITSSGGGHDLCSGPFYINEVPSLTTILYTARTTGTVSGSLVGKVYPRTDSFYRHRPFDGGVQLGTGSPAHGAQAVRQSKKYIRYQSGKGIMYTTGALFAPNYDLRSAISTGTGVGSIITLKTDDLNHGFQVGAQIQLRGITSTGYNGHYVVASVVDEITFTVIATQVLEHTNAQFGEQPVVSLYKWKGSTVRAGAFDDQNGIFIQYDGDIVSCGLRSSTYQIAGTVTATPDSNTLTGVNTKFTEQLKVGDRIVIRGMCHLVTEIDDDSTLYMNPDYRGVTTVSNVKAALTKEILIPQSQWNLDRADGTGKSGYITDITKMQMMGFQYSWYGAGFIDWMFRGPSGDFVFLHRLKNNNMNNEAFMRSGNLPVRYEVINEGARGRVEVAMDSSQETMTLEDGTLFPSSGTLIMNNEIINYNNKTGNILSGLTRAATHTNFAGGSQRTYTAGSAIAHTKGSGVVLLSTTATPQINHWGSAFLTDGGFDEDRGYLFSWQEKEIEISTSKSAIFLIRLSPSVSNSVTGDLGERELINRAQLLLKNIEITTQGGSSSQGVIVEGVMNPKNYPDDPTSILWNGLNTGGAGGQPSFAQVASGGDVTWEGAASAITATNANTQNYNTTWIIFNRTDVAGVQIGWKVSGGNLKGGATVANIRDYYYDSNKVYLIFSDRTRPGTAGSTTYTFEPIVEAAIPGEQVFSFTASGGGERDNLDLSELKELTNTPIGGRGTFPNGPDVLAINAYLTSGSAINATINLRWAEAQA